MAGFANIAEDYFRSLNPMAARIHADIVETKNIYENLWNTFDQSEKTEILDECIIKPEIAIKYAYLDTLEINLNEKKFNKNDLLSYFDVECGQRIIHDDSSKFKDEHSSPFSFHTKSQLDLCNFNEIRVIKPKDKLQRPVTPPILKTDLAISHSKVVSELKNALKSSEKFEAKERECEFSPKPKAFEESSGSNFISKFIGNKRGNKTNNEEREYLVSPERQCQIIASSDNFFKTNFHSSDTRESVSSPTNVKGLSYRCNSGLEESHALLAVGSCKSADTESLLCDTDDSIPCSLPKTGLDFLDNW